jgi:hypothetical protein
MRELWETVQPAAGWAVDIAVAFAAFLWETPVTLPLPGLAALAVVLFLFGLLLGRISARRMSGDGDRAPRMMEERIPLDIEKLRPLGAPAEEITESRAMDISGIRADDARDQPASQHR